MNTQQEQQFVDPGTFSGDRRPINTDPREQPGYMPPAANFDPREQPQWQPTPPVMAYPPQPAHSPWRWVGISAVLLVVIFGGLFTASALLTHEITSTKTFAVGNAPKLVVTANAGNVQIVNGPAGQISVVARQRAFSGDNGPIPVHYDLSSDGTTLTVSADQSSGGFTFGFSYYSIDFDITAPAQTALDIHTDSGDITSNGVNGPMTLTTSSGNITTDGGSGQITLTTSSGDIKASNVSGQMTLSTSSGNVTAINASASGNSSFETSSGDITYNGSLAPKGTYSFRASSGDVTVTLPGDSALQVQASTDSGDISSDFSGVIVQRGDGSGATASGSSGSAPYAQVTLTTSSGDIHLRQA
jgi:hypothetical protein